GGGGAAGVGVVARVPGGVGPLSWRLPPHAARPNAASAVTASTAEAFFIRSPFLSRWWILTLYVARRSQDWTAMPPAPPKGELFVELLVGLLVGEDDDPIGADRLGVGEGHDAGIQPLREEALAVAQHHREDHQPVLVDHAIGQQR